MVTYYTDRPSEEHIKKMLEKAKQVNKKQLEVLSMNEELLCKIESPNHHKKTLGFRKGKF